MEKINPEATRGAALTNETQETGHEPKTRGHYDVIIIGGGINGCGIARDAAGRGYNVCLAEMNDLASGTSSWSTKLIHGGLRYLEYYEFRLVREALIERERLWELAPHIIRPLRFILPHHKGLRPAWLIRLGLFLYDHLGGRKRLDPTRTVDLKSSAFGAPLKPIFGKGFEYSDCWVDDARLVILNAVDAAKHGADICVGQKVIAATHHGDKWQVTLEDTHTGTQKTITAKLLINAAGPWVDRVRGRTSDEDKTAHIRLVQGSHIVVNKLYDHDRCYIFQNDDNRIIFAIPYEQDYTLIGTTDRDFDGDPADVKITQEEIDYLCEAASDYFAKPVTPDEIVWTYSGVRPLYDDGASAAQEATRDYTIEIERAHETAPAMINIYGGKITTFRKLANAVMEKIAGEIGEKGPEWSGTQSLPGGDFGISERSKLEQKLQNTYPFLTAKICERLINAYGMNAFQIFDQAKQQESALPGTDYSGAAQAGLFEAEIIYLMQHEWARTVDDVIWRRSKLGLRMSNAEINALEKLMERLA